MNILERFDSFGNELSVQRHDSSVVTIKVTGEHPDRFQRVTVDVEDMVSLAYELLRISGADDDAVRTALEVLRPTLDNYVQSDSIEVWSA